MDPAVRDVKGASSDGRGDATGDSPTAPGARPALSSHSAEAGDARRPGGGVGHGAHADAHGGGHEDHARVFRDRFWVTLALTVPVVVFSRTFQMLLGYDAPQFTGSELIPPVAGTLTFLYGGAPFLLGGWNEARHRRPGMMLLIALAITVAFVASAATELGALHLDFWWELAALITVMLLGHWQEMRAVGQASNALSALAELLPDEAERVTASGTETVPVSALEESDVVLVRPGGRVPADGVIVEGAVEVDESMLTGESRPRRRTVGERVVAGSVVTDASVRVRVDAVGEDTALAGIRRLVEEAQGSRSRAQALADRAAALLFYVAVLAGGVTYVAWTLSGQLATAVERTVTVLVIACPHALGLAIPLVISISTAVSARNGILVKDRLALERMREVDAVLFDKTGTLTEARHVVAGVATLDGDGDGVLRTAAAVEADSEHPLARGIVTAARATGEIPKATSFRSLTGRGVEARLEGRSVAVGGPSLLRQRSITVPERLESQTSSWAERGAAILYVLDGSRVIGALALEDAIRPESREAVERLHALGIKVAMITGDARQVAEAVARDLGIDEVFAEVLPEEKDAAVADLQRRGHTVVMVGDGVNDAPALARADVGVAIGAGTDVAIESAGIVLASDDPRAVIDVIKLSKATYRKMVQNLLWATGYNAFAIPVAGGALAWAGITLDPAVAAVLMSLSTIIVALNAQTLRRVRIGPGTSRVGAAS
jgi:P-type Cu2+ transporter